MSGLDPDYDGFHVYGSKTAFKFEIVKNANKVQVVSLDAANKVGTSFDWQTKIAFQITPSELPSFVCCLLGLTAEFKADFHGPKSDKALRLATQLQRGSMYMKVWQAGIHIGIEVPADKVFHLAVLSMKVLASQTGFDSATCLAVLRGTAGRLLNSKN